MHRLSLYLATALAVSLVALSLAGCSGNATVAGTADETKNKDDGDEKKHTNRLSDETSPYLLMHAHNPVNWYPWGEEALEKAKKENKLIFLSVGYSSCHWCHVMERESFMDAEIAALLNEHFVCIKVDREERPDIDSIYMTAVQILTRRGGWPMSVFLTPDARPFWGGTYFPARDGDRPGMRGFLTILQAMQQYWTENPQLITEDATRLTAAIQEELESRSPAAAAPLDAAMIDAVQTALAEQFDAEHGGFGFQIGNPNMPKFPEPSNLVFLLYRVEQQQLDPQQRQQALEMLTTTLDQMAQGGIRDHLGGGFHRYSVDRMWAIPHFEKMLYDNGQLASVYSEAYRITGNNAYRRVVDELVAFLLREMTDPEGGFYAALDAESEGEEGKFYRWSRDELTETLDDDQYGLLADAYGVAGEPNFEHDYYVLQLNAPLADVAARRGSNEEELLERWQPIREKLFELRETRPRPFLDTKVLSGWNGLMIRGLADAGRILERPDYVEAAERAAEFVWTNMRNEDGRLLRTYRDGSAKLDAYLTDYAYVVNGMLALHQATQKQLWLDRAQQLTDLQLQLFWDEEHKDFFFTSTDHESLLARLKDPVDGAEPAGNSVTAENLLKLTKLTDKPAYQEKLKATLETDAGLIQLAPSVAPRMATVLARWLDEGAQP